MDRITETKILDIKDDAKLPSKPKLYNNSEVPEEIIPLIIAVANERDVAYDPVRAFESMADDPKACKVNPRQFEEWIRRKLTARFEKKEIAHFMSYVSYTKSEEEMSKI